MVVWLCNILYHTLYTDRSIYCFILYKQENMWKIMHAFRKKQFIGTGITHRLCTWPPDDFNGTLRKIKEANQYMKTLDKKTLDELKL
jgi:hypothetical protein